MVRVDAVDLPSGRANDERPPIHVRRPTPPRSTPVNAPSGFSYQRRKSGEVVIVHHGRVAAILRGRRATDFLDDVDRGDEQELMARLTGNYKHGNERLARQHPRRRGG